MAGDTTDTAPPSWLRATAPQEFLANYSVGLIGLQQAINNGFTGAGTVIVVIDNGFDVDHPFLQGKIIEAIDTGAGGGPVALRFHGTHVAGIASGVAPGARLAFYTYGKVTNTAAAFLAGARQGAVVYNNSWGDDTDVNDVLTDPAFATDRFQALENVVGSDTAADWRTFIDAMREAQNTGVIVFAASNDPNLSDIDISAAMPLVFPELRDAWIAVVNVNPDGDVISVTCGSAAAFCLAAPGGDREGGPADKINSTVPGGGFGVESGTSMAAPHVSGAVALASEIFPAATPAQLSQLILQTATDVGTRGIDPVYGWGILNVGNIVDTIEPRTAATFANASWSRFSALGHAGSAMRQRMTLPAPAGGGVASGAGLTSYASVTAHSTGGAVGLSNPIVSGVWAAPLYGYSTINTGPASRSARSETAGVLIGVDIVSDAVVRFGIAGGYSHTRLSTRGSADSGRSDAFHVGLYGSFNSDGWYMQGNGQVAFFEQSLTRHEIAGAQGTSSTPVGRSLF